MTPAIFKKISNEVQNRTVRNDFNFKTYTVPAGDYNDQKYSLKFILK